MKMHYTIRAIPPTEGEMLPDHIDPSVYVNNRQETYTREATKDHADKCEKVIRENGGDTVRVLVSPLVQKAFN